MTLAGYMFFPSMNHYVNHKLSQATFDPQLCTVIWAICLNSNGDPKENSLQFLSIAKHVKSWPNVCLALAMPYPDVKAIFHIWPKS